MSELSKKREVRVVPIPDSLYKKLEKKAKEEDVSVAGITCRALIDYLENNTNKKHKKRQNAQIKTKQA